MSLTAASTSHAYAQPLGTKTLYTFASNAASAGAVAGREEDPSPPAGYSPFFINHVGRHGARHVTNLKELLSLDHFLQSADEARALRADGERLKKMVYSILEVEKKYPPGGLSGIGGTEQYGIGKRMGDRFSELIRQPGDCLQVTTTPEERTVQSAEHFLEGLAAAPGCLTRITNDSIQLRFFSVSPAYIAFAKRGAWKKIQARLDSSEAVKSVNTAILHRLFDSAFVGHLEQGQLETFGGPAAFTAALYAAAVIVPGLADEIRTAGFRPSDLNIFSLLSSAEAEELAFVDGSKDFLAKGPGIDTNGIQVRVAAPLLADFVQSSDEWLGAGKQGADLRFAHAETIAPIAALMGLEGAATAVNDPFRYTEVWKTGQVIGFSANIQWIFYRKTAEKVTRPGGGSTENGSTANGLSGKESMKPGGDFLVKILYNETPVHLPIATTCFPYYRWDEVRQYYTGKLHNLGLDGGMDRYAYLRDLK